jgi:hypothetical protein
MRFSAFPGMPRIRSGFVAYDTRLCCAEWRLEAARVLGGWKTRTLQPPGRPGDMRNLAGERAGEAKELLERLQDWRMETSARMPTRNSPEKAR